jgi:hypothetical protein
LLEFNKIAPKVFAVQGDKVFLGGEEVTPQIKSILADQAHNLLTSQLWEILYSSIVNEAYDISLRQSTDFNHVLSAKMLHHWAHYTKNIIIKLAKFSK